VLVVSRFVVTGAEGEDFAARGRRAIEVLAERPGFRSARLGRAADDPTAWVLVTEWQHVGAWRRALSSYEVKLEATPLLALAADEPSAFEVLNAADAQGLPDASGAGRPARHRTGSSHRVDEAGPTDAD